MKNGLLFSAFFLLISLQNLFSQARYLEPAFDQVSVTNNILYGQNASILPLMLPAPPPDGAVLQPLRLDFYEPSGDTASARPLVIVLHGGSYLPPSASGLCAGEKTDSAVVEICTRLAKMGYTAASIDYRLGWNPLSPDEIVRRWTLVNALYRGIQDTRTAIRFFKKTVAEDANPFRVDTSRIVVWGESNGGQIALGAAYARDSFDWIDPTLMVPGLFPMITPQMNGNLWGTDWGVVPSNAPPFLYTMPGDTLCYPNWSGYSSDFQLCVSMAGFIPNLPWVSFGEIPAVLYHAPNDLFAPCYDGFLSIPPVFLPVISAVGSCVLAEQLDAAGNNQVFKDADINDCVTANANNLNGGLEGFYPFIGLNPAKGRPWHWISAPCPNNPDVSTDAAFARQYLDTVFAYFAPRACAALALCNPQPDPTGLCGPEVKGKVFLDINENATFDAGEQPFPGIVFELQPGDRHAVSGPNGNFSISAPPGDYTLDVPNPPTYYVSTNAPASVTVTADTDIVQDIGMKPTVTVNDLQVFLTPLTDPRPGFYNLFTVKWKNIGTTQLSGTVTLTVDSNYDLLDSEPAANITGSVAIWTFSNLPPLQSGSAWLQVQLPSSVSIGTAVSSTAVVEPTAATDNTPYNNTATVEQIVVGSFDPNDKRVLPEGDLTESVFLQNNYDKLDYTIRFQNTGNASAVNVFIVDTLSDLLETSTLEIVGTSHPLRWEISGQRTVTWFFDNINLPDSVNNEPASHGFVRYRIAPRQPFDDLLNKTAYNFADIYFDFNAPVRTNTTATKFYQSVGTNAPAAAGFVQISPNPAYEQVTVSCLLAASEAELSIFDVSGKMVLFQETPVQGQRLNVVVGTGDLPKGSYFLKIAGGGEVRTGRFVRE